jgi:hypothetical protein
MKRSIRKKMQKNTGTVPVMVDHGLGDGSTNLPDPIMKKIFFG